MPDEEEESGANRSANTPSLLTSQNLFSISQISQISQIQKKCMIVMVTLSMFLATLLNLVKPTYPPM